MHAMGLLHPWVSHLLIHAAEDQKLSLIRVWEFSTVGIDSNGLVERLHTPIPSECAAHGFGGLQSCVSVTPSTLKCLIIRKRSPPHSLTVGRHPSPPSPCQPLVSFLCLRICPFWLFPGTRVTQSAQSWVSGFSHGAPCTDVFTVHPCCSTRQRLTTSHGHGRVHRVDGPFRSSIH